MKRMDQIIDKFVNARQNIITILEKVPAEKVEEKLFGTWTLKDVVAHFTAWDRYFTQAALLLKQKKIMPYWESVNTFNANSVARVTKLKWDKVLADFVKVNNQFIEVYKKLPDELLNKKLWEHKSHTLAKFLETNLEHYTNDQIKAITKLAKKWKK